MEETANVETTGEEQAQDVSTTQDNGNTSQAKPAAPVKKSYEVKVNNETKKLDLTDDELKVYLQKGMAADQKFSEAAKMRKEAESARAELDAFYKAVKENPRETLKKHPILKDINWLEMSEAELLEHLQEQAKDPKDRELETVKARLAHYEEQERLKKEEEEKAKETTETTKRIEAAKNMFAKQITDVLKVEGSKLPADPRTVGRIAQYMKGAMQSGIEATPAEIAAHVYDDYKSDFASFSKDATPEQLIELIGPETFQRMRKWDIERIQSGKAMPAQKQVQQAPAQPKKPKNKYETIEQRNLKEFGSVYVFPDDY